MNCDANRLAAQWMMEEAYDPEGAADLFSGPSPFSFAPPAFQPYFAPTPLPPIGATYCNLQVCQAVSQLLFWSLSTTTDRPDD